MNRKIIRQIHNWQEKNAGNQLNLNVEVLLKLFQSRQNYRCHKIMPPLFLLRSMYYTKKLSSVIYYERVEAGGWKSTRHFDWRERTGATDTHTIARTQGVAGTISSRIRKVQEQRQFFATSLRSSYK